MLRSLKLYSFDEKFMLANKMISVVISGVRYREFDLLFSVNEIKKIFPAAEIILSSNDKELIYRYKEENLFDKVILTDAFGELPSLKFPEGLDSALINNNINLQIDANYKGISAASHDLVLKLRTDQVLIGDSIFKLWSKLEDINPVTNKKGLILTSSIFSINPRYSERMPFHISDMLQLGYKSDLLSYYSAPTYPFEYATWYERNNHAGYSNSNEKAFRSKYAVEQWLTMHYIYEHESHFPVSFHNDYSEAKITEFEQQFPRYFFVAHPDDIGLRVSKFESARSYFNTQCYSTHESIKLLSNLFPQYQIDNSYNVKGINKNFYHYLKFFLDRKVIQLMIKNMPVGLKKKLKKIIS